MKKDYLFIESNENILNSSSIVSKKDVTENLKITDIELNKEEAKKLKKDQGKYITIFYDKIAVTKEIEKLIDLVEDSIKKTLEYLKLNKNSNVLFVGLGNKSLMVDKLGYLTIEKIALNNHCYKIYKDVESLTNIDTVDFIKSLVKLLDVDLVVIFDSLKATSIERLGATIQISTGGMMINNKMLNKKTIKCNLISIGVPSIIDLKSIAEDNPKLLVTVDLIDEIIETSSSLLSIVINRLF